LPRLDEIDQAILKALSADARVSNAEIARQTGIPERTVHYRLRRLFDTRQIRAALVVDPFAVGYTLAVDFFCELEPGCMEQAVAQLLPMPEITYLALSTGDEDLSIQAVFRSIDEMQVFITEKLHQVLGIRKTRTILIPRILKDTYQWRPPAE